MEIIEINGSDRLDYEMTKASENFQNFNLKEFLSNNNYLDALSRKDISKYLTNYIYDYLNSCNIGKHHTKRYRKKLNIDENDPRVLLAKKIKKKFPDKDFTYQLIKSILDSSLNIFAGSNCSITNSEEIINEISHFYFIKKTLDFYSSKSLRDILFNRNFRSDEEFIISKHLKNIYFQHKIIKDIEVPGSLSYSKLKYYLEGPQQLRRPVDKEYNHYRYIPILCRNFCEENFNNFYGKLSLEEKNILDKNEEIFYSIKFYFLKNCIFAHNYSEVNFHPFKYKTKICKNKNCQLKGVSCYLDHNKDEFVQIFVISQFSEILLEIEKLIETEKNKNYEMLKKFSVNNKLIESFDGFDIFNFKTQPCKKGKLCADIKKCKFYHNNFERRRDFQTLQTLHKISGKTEKSYYQNNQPCETIFKEGKWLNPELCPKTDACEYFHTRNELFYDIRNFRKIYECPNEKSDGECFYSLICPYKHSFNINTSELYLPKKEKKEIEDLLGKFKTLSKEYETLQKKISENKIICLNCKNYIVGRMAVFKCGHNLCEYCVSSENKLEDCVFRCDSKQNNQITKVKKVGNDHQLYDLISLNKRDISRMEGNDSRVLEFGLPIQDDRGILNEQDLQFYNLSDDDEEILDFSKLDAEI